MTPVGSVDAEFPGVRLGLVARLGDPPEIDARRVFTLIEFFDGCSILRKERQREVARVVNRGRWKIDLFTGLRLLATNLKFVETRRWYFDSVDDECAFVAVDEVDPYLRLTKNLLVVGR